VPAEENEHLSTLIDPLKPAVYTFASCHDHESGAVSICADPKASSGEAVLQGNRWSMKHFDEHIRAGVAEDGIRPPGPKFSQLLKLYCRMLST
jgi:hypothetical protein